MLKNVFYLNEQGKRKNLEDNIFPLPGTASMSGRLFIVCDGVGGLSKGEEASRIACATIGKSLSQGSPKNIDSTRVKAAISEALADMALYADENAGARQMSTTMTLVHLNDNGVLAAWCGDSRIHHIRDGKVIWRSKDHSMVQQLIDAGEITKEEAVRHPQKNVILRSLSAGNGNSVTDLHTITDIKPGDYLLLCTDGVLENINEDAIAQILGPQQKERDKRKLFLEYCGGKTNDNFSMYLLETGGGKKKPYVWYALALIAILVVGYLLARPASNTQNPQPASNPQSQPATSQKLRTEQSDSGMLNQLEQSINKEKKKK